MRINRSTVVGATGDGVAAFTRRGTRRRSAAGGSYVRSLNALRRRLWRELRAGLLDGSREERILAVVRFVEASQSNGKLSLRRILMATAEEIRTALPPDEFCFSCTSLWRHGRRWVMAGRPVESAFFLRDYRNCGRPSKLGSRRASPRPTRARMGPVGTTAAVALRDLDLHHGFLPYLRRDIRPVSDLNSAPVFHHDHKHQT